MKAIAVDGCTLKCRSGNGTITITSTPSTNVKAGGKGVYRGPLQFSVSGYMGGEITNGDGMGTGSISPGSTTTKANGQFVLLEGDESTTITLNGTKPSQTGSQSATATDTVYIDSAGQTNVKSN